MVFFLHRRETHEFEKSDAMFLGIAALETGLLIQALELLWQDHLLAD